LPEPRSRVTQLAEAALDHVERGKIQHRRQRKHDEAQEADAKETHDSMSVRHEATRADDE
jgi:hypothetical protein